MAEAVPPPGNIAWLVHLVGQDAALRVLEYYGGMMLFVPKKLSARSEIVMTTGLPVAALLPLAREHGGERLSVALCKEWRAHVYRARDGASYTEIARRLRVSVSTVYRMLDRGEMTAKQFELPI
jgi:hypothetical protein